MSHLNLNPDRLILARSCQSISWTYGRSTKENLEWPEFYFRCNEARIVLYVVLILLKFSIYLPSTQFIKLIPYSASGRALLTQS